MAPSDEGYSPRDIRFISLTNLPDQPPTTRASSVSYAMAWRPSSPSRSASPLRAVCSAVPSGFRATPTVAKSQRPGASAGSLAGVFLPWPKARTAEHSRATT